MVDTYKDAVEKIVKKYYSGEIVPSEPLSSITYNLGARDIAGIFIDIENQLGINLDKLFDNLEGYAIDDIVASIGKI